MYDIAGIWIALALLGSMFAIGWLGRRLGKRRAPRDETETTQVTATQASLLGILGLLLGFTFSLALNRHDARSAAVVAEANAIGTAWLRTDLLEDPSPAQAALRAYVSERIAAATVTAADAERALRVRAAESAFAILWSGAARTARETPNPATVAFTNALNDMIDELAARDAAINRNVPEVVLLMLYGTFLLSGFLMGYGSGVSRQPIRVPTLVMPVLIVALVWLIIDLDRPRRGLITVDQAPLIAAGQAMGL